MRSLVALFALAATVRIVAADDIPDRPKMTPDLPPPSATEVFEPVPRVVASLAGGIPSDAIVLFDGKSLDGWESVKEPGKPAPWKVEDGTLVVAPKTGDIRTKARFGDIQLHVEWRVPADVKGSGQNRGNAGIFFMGLYELQLLDSLDNPTYVNGIAGAVYKQHPPLVNAARPAGEWQTYDVVWTAPRFTTEGKLERPARITVLLNGVLVQNNTALLGPTTNRGRFTYFAHAGKLPLMLQEHGNAVAFRNFWVRELDLPENK